MVTWLEALQNLTSRPCAQTTTMKFITALSFLSAASAFAPVQQSTKSTTQLNLWGEPSQKDGESDKSQALPFAPRPKLLDGTLAGDAGFE